jgi:cephalosporin hydroxylase
MSEEIQGWFDFQNIYDRMIDDCREGGTLIELGVWKGKSLCYLAHKALAANKRLNVIGIDNFQHDDWDGYIQIQHVDRKNGEKRTVRQQCEDNLAAVGVLNNVRLIESDSIAAASLFDDGSIDFLFIDDTHNSEHIKAEIAAWLPKMRRPAWMAGHDFPGNIFYGVISHFPDAEQDGTSWIVRVA